MKISVFKPKRKKNYMVEWRCPVTGKMKTKSTGTHLKKQALAFMLQLEQQILLGGSFTGQLSWNEFVNRYAEEELCDLAETTQLEAIGTLRKVKKLIDPETIQKLDTNQVARFRQKLRKTTKTKVVDGKKAKVLISPATVNKHLRHLRSALSWAKRVGIIEQIPDVNMIRRTGTGAKSRAVTGEELDRMIEAVKKVFSNEKQQLAYKHLLTGLSLTGLRISEAVNLKWNEGNVALQHINNIPHFVFSTGGQKNKKSQSIPCTPDFTQFLADYPSKSQRGYVFKLGDPQPIVSTVSSKIADIGKAALVLTAEGKYASAHDLRRAFGVRWAQKVMPAVLMRLMRHSSIETTMKYYVGQEIDSIVDALYYNKKSGETDQSTDLNAQKR